MVTSVSASGPVTGAAPVAAPVAGARPDPQDLFKRLDSQGKGYLAPEDLASAIVKISPRGSSLSLEAAQAQAQAVFEKMDPNKDGKITQAEFTQAAAARSESTGDPVQALAAGDERPAGDVKKAKKPAAPAGQAPATSGAGPIYAPADGNRDGTVTVPERYAYETQQAPRAPQSSGSGQTPSAAARLALQAYRSVDQLAAA
jgi:hypothetical protein